MQRTLTTGDLLFILFVLSYFAYVELTTNLLVWSNPSISIKQEVPQLYSDPSPFGECSLAYKITSSALTERPILFGLYYNLLIIMFSFSEGDYIAFSTQDLVPVFNFVYSFGWEPWSNVMRGDSRL